MNITLYDLPVVEFSHEIVFPGFLCFDPAPVLLEFSEWITIFDDAGPTPTRTGVLAHREVSEGRRVLHAVKRVRRGPRWLGRAAVVSFPESQTSAAVIQAARDELLTPLMKYIIKHGNPLHLENANRIEAASLADWVCGNLSLHAPDSRYLLDEEDPAKRLIYLRDLILAQLAFESA